jgi:hypothetical protein
MSGFSGISLFSFTQDDVRGKWYTIGFAFNVLKIPQERGCERFFIKNSDFI